MGLIRDRFSQLRDYLEHEVELKHYESCNYRIQIVSYILALLFYREGTVQEERWVKREYKHLH